MNKIQERGVLLPRCIQARIKYRSREHCSQEMTKKSHHIYVIGIWRGVFILKLCSWGRNHFIHPWLSRPLFDIQLPCLILLSPLWQIPLWHQVVHASATQQNSYSISHLLGTVTTQWLPLWRCSHCSLVPDTVTTEQWLHRTHTLLGIHYHGAFVEICLLGT